MNVSAQAIFLEKALATVPRVLGFCDRESESPTFGCCDRIYWHYRLIDVSNARFQEAGLLMALAFSTPLPGNRFAGNERMKQWSRAVWRFWLDRRNADGSANEVYPRERSFCATAFSAAAFMETLILLNAAEQWQEEVKRAAPTFVWLADHRNPDVANQMAASLLALARFATVTENAAAKRAVQRRRDELLRAAGHDCEFKEYGGIDYGYLSITLSLLAHYTDFLQDPAMADVVRRGVLRLEKAMDECGRLDASRNSRFTQYVYPYALAFCHSPALEKLAEGLRQDRVLNPAWMDDRYCIAMAVDYWQTGDICRSC